MTSVKGSNISTGAMNGCHHYERLRFVIYLGESREFRSSET